MKRRGLTLPEVMIYVVMCFLAVAAVSALFMLGRSAQQTTVSGYLVSGEADTALRWLRRDLQETALVSIRTYPNPEKPSEPPGCSLISPRQPSEKNPDFQVSPYGKPLWSKHVFYTLKLNGAGRVGDLIRWEQPLTPEEKDYVPHVANLMPSSISNSTNKRVLLRNVIGPKQDVKNLLGADNFKTDDSGGFRVQFVQRIGGESGNEQLSWVNPGDTSQPQVPENHTTLVAVRLQILAVDRDKPSFYELSFKVHPRS